MQRLLILFVVIVGLACAQDATIGFRVTIENLSAGSSLATALSPVAWSVHAGVSPLYNPRRAASKGLQVLAEDGNPVMLVAEANNSTDPEVKSNGVAYQTPGKLNGAAPGEFIEFGITGVPGDKVSFATMYVQTNDRFFAPSSDGYALFDSDNKPRSGTVDVLLFDAGTEINERPGIGINQPGRQPQGNVGQNENGVVTESTQNLDGFTYAPTATIIRVTVTAATTFRFKVDNLSPGSAVPTPLSPILYVVHQNKNVLKTPGMPASTGLKKLAEDGDASTALAEVKNQTGVIFAGITSAVPPGGSHEFRAFVPQGSFFSFYTMFVASNDRFYGPRSTRGIDLYHAGAPVTGVLTNLAFFDAGTEINQKPGSGSNQPGPGRAPGSGAPETNGVVAFADAQNDGFSYPPQASVIQITSAPLSGVGFTAKTFDQKLNVNFVFSNMIKA